MTTEDDFQRALDAEPDAWQTRLVFADWLQEHGDPRAEGYRALGLLQRVPLKQGKPWRFNHNLDDVWLSHILHPRTEGYIQKEYVLPATWVAAASPDGRRTDIVRSTRREVEDEAARAFAKLPEERRAELLALKLVPRKPSPKKPAKRAKKAPKPFAKKSKRARGKK